MRAHHTVTKIKALALICIVSIGPAFGQQAQNPLPETRARLAPPANGPIKVAFVVTDGSVVIDFAGPWEVFQDVMLVPKGGSIHQPGVKHPFELYTVSDTKQPIRASGGMRVIPDFTFDDAPQPDIVVIPAQDGASPKMMDWIRRMAGHSAVVMSVCTGAFTLAQTGLLNGKNATTHHDNWGLLHSQFPTITVQTNKRYVQSAPLIFTSGGLSAGIDLALHIVDLYFGREVAATTAYTMEYEGTGWRSGLASVKYKDGMKGMTMENGSHSMN
jgi:transcriptional regulator GlxA family with amidase domain